MRLPGKPNLHEGPRSEIRMIRARRDKKTPTSRWALKGELSGFYLAVFEVQAGHVVGQVLLFFGGGEQPQLGAALQDVLSVQGPFLTAQVVNFAAV